MRLIFPFTLCLVLIVDMVNGQIAGDYRSNSAPTGGNWNALGSWQRYSGSGWAAPTSLEGTPSSASNTITIRANSPITLNINVTVDQLLIEPSAVLTVSGALNRNLTIANGVGTDLTVNGTLIINGILTVNASATVINSGTLESNNTFNNNGSYNGVSSTSIFNSTNINGTGTTNFNDVNVLDGGIVSINGSDVNLFGALVLEGPDSSFDADGDTDTGVFKVTSTSLSSGGRIASLPAPGNFSGNVTIQRFLDGRTGGDYRYLSMPVVNGSLNFWRTSIGVTGNFSDRSVNSVALPAIVNSGNTNPSVFEWDPTVPNYLAVNGSGGSMSSIVLDHTKAYVAYNFSVADVTASYTGAAVTGPVSIPISDVASSFHLIPNPYPSPIDWDLVASDNTSLNGSMWFRTANGVFFPYTLDMSPPDDPNDFAGEIAIGQSFWVQATGNGATVEMQESHKTLADASFVRKQTATNYFWITLASATQKDYAAIRFHADATDEQDRLYDAVKMRNVNYINLSTQILDKDYSINSISELKECSKRIGLKVADVKPGDYSIQFNDMSKLDLNYRIVLIDHFLNKEKVVENGMTYSFAVTADVASFGSSRFEVKFEKVIQPKITVEGQTLVSSIKTGNQWYKDGELIVGATEATYETSVSGSYLVKVTENGCEYTADNIVMTITAVPETAEKIVKVFPNPTAGKIMINLSREEDQDLTGVYLYDTKGSIIVDSRKEISLLKPGEKFIDISNSKGGVYILNLVSGNQVKSIRLIKK